MKTPILATSVVMCVLAAVSSLGDEIPAVAQTCELAETVKVTASDASPGDKFGSAVLLSEDWLFVGAPFRDEIDQDSGVVYVFRPGPARITG